MEADSPAGIARHLGEKLSILYRLHDDPEHAMSEVVGLLQQVEATDEGRVFFVIKRDGRIVEVPEADIVTLKVVPTSRS